jgi:transcriptional regulator with XRE-family HTH domain
MARISKNDEIIGQKIEFYRLFRRKSRKWLADKLNRTYQQIQNYEIGKHRVSASTIFEISKILKISLTNFFPNKNDNEKIDL